MSTSVHIGQTIRNACVFNFRRYEKSPMNADALVQTVSRFFSLLDEREVEYLLVGGVAMLHYVEGRNTEDIDLIVGVASLGALPEITIEHRDGHFACGRFDDLRVELLLTTNPLFALVQRRYATQHTFRERRIPCATVEGLILLKLYALPSLYRQGNFAPVGLYENDLATLMHTYQPDLEPLFADLGSQLSPAGPGGGAPNHRRAPAAHRAFPASLEVGPRLCPSKARSGQPLPWNLERRMRSGGR